MFELKSKVVYGVIGVCEIVQIAPPPIKGIEADYYYLQPVYDDKGIIYSPVASTKVMMRNIITADEAQKLVDMAKECATDELLNEKVMPMQYDEYVKSQEPVKLMHLVRALYNIKNERARELRKMKSADSRMLTAARKLLYGEISEALDKSFEDVTLMLDTYLSAL